MSFRLKTILWVALIETIMLAYLLFAGLNLIQDLSAQEIEKRAATTTTLAFAMTQDSILSNDIASLQSFSALVAKAPGVAYVRILIHNKVVASAGDSESLALPFQRDHSYKEVNDGALDTSAAIKVDGVEYGRIELGISTASTREMIAYARQGGFTIAALELALVACFSFLLGSYLTRQLSELQLATQQIAGGNYGHLIPIRGSDELAQTAIAFNTMSAQINEAHKVLEENHTRNKIILDTIIDGVLMLDNVGNIQSANPATQRIFTYALDEMMGRNISTLMEEPYRSKYNDYFMHYTNSGDANTLATCREVIGLNQDGAHIPIELAVTEIMVGNIPMFVCIVRDITEHKQVQQQQSEFISTVSHELRTPLTSISGALGLLAGGALGKMSTQMKQMVELAYKNSQRLSHLIDDLLDMEKLVDGKMVLEIKPQPLMPLIEQTLESIRAYGEPLKVDFVLMSKVDVQVLVDGSRLMQVLNNFLSNAAKFSPPNKQVEVAVRLENDMVRVAVKDYGMGVPSDFRVRIFQKFSQADSSDTRQKGGTGLGLAISKELIERMDGVIGFDSIEGEGACFYFEFKVCP